MFEKLVIAPQIIVYKNLFEHCDELIDIIENKDRTDSLWPKWEPWYDQGENISQLFYRKDFYSEDNDEKKILKYIANVYDFIQKEYLDDYLKEKGVWPTYINQWEKVYEKLDPVPINIYKYSEELFKTKSKDGLMLEYHVDEMPEINDSDWHQIVTITFYLNDNYDGGEICFYSEAENKAYKYKPKKGDVTVFPSGAPFYHAVENFSGADRYFMRIFIPYSTEGDKEFIENSVFYDEDFMKKQEEKTNDFVSKYTHAVTLQFPGQRVDKVYGKLVQLDENIIIIK